MKKVNIGVFYKKSKLEWVLLKDISTFLTDKQLIPNQGDRVTAIGNDHEVMGISSDDPANCLSTCEKIFHYTSYDVAVICEYKAF